MPSRRQPGNEGTDTVRCRACDGSGRVRLAPHQQEVLDLLRRRGELTAGQVRLALRLHNGSPTATNNALEDLRAAGFVRRRRGRGQKGRGAWLYEAPDWASTRSRAS